MVKTFIINAVILLLLFLSSGCKKDSPTEPQPTKPPGYQEDIPWPSLADSPWPMFQHDPQFTGRSKYIGPSCGIITSTIETSGYQNGYLTIDELNNIYFVSSFSRDSVNLNTVVLNKYSIGGKLLWHKNIASSLNPEIFSSPLISRTNQVFSASFGGNFFIIDSSGNAINSLPLNDQVLTGGAGIIIDKNSNLYFSGMKGLYSLDRDLNIKWMLPEYPRSCVLFSPDGNTLYTSSQNYVSALDLNGNIKWSLNNFGNWVNRYPLIDNSENIYILNDSVFACINNGNIVWKFNLKIDESGADVASTIDKNGDITFATNSRVYQVNYKGNLNWEKNITGVSTHLINDGECNIYFATYEGDIYCLDKYGEIKWEISSPVKTMETMVLLEHKLVVWGWNSADTKILIIQ